MRSLMLDELASWEMAAVKDYLAVQAEFSGVTGLYWLSLPSELWADSQRQAHTGRLPGAESYRLAVETGASWVRFELLVRSETLANHGSGPVTAEQALFVFKWAESMAKQLNLVTCLGSTSEPQEPKTT